MTMPAKRTFLIFPSSFFSAYPSEICCSGRRIDDDLLSSGKNISSHARTDTIDQHSQYDDHAHESLLPIGIDLREHEAIADHFQQRAANDGPERATDAAGEIGTA